MSAATWSCTQIMQFGLTPEKIARFVFYRERRPLIDTLLEHRSFIIMPSTSCYSSNPMAVVVPYYHATDADWFYWCKQSKWTENCATCGGHMNGSSFVVICIQFTHISHVHTHTHTAGQCCMNRLWQQTCRKMIGKFHMQTRHTVKHHIKPTGKHSK